MENPVGFNFWLFTAVFSCFHVYSKCAQKLDVRLLCCGFLALCVPHVWIISQVFPLIWIQNGFYYALPVQRHFPSVITCTAVQTTKPSITSTKNKKLMGHWEIDSGLAGQCPLKNGGKLNRFFCLHHTKELSSFTNHNTLQWRGCCWRNEPQVCHLCN